MTARAKLRSLAPKLALLAGSLLLACVVGELALRALGYYGVREGRVEKLRLVDDEVLDFRHVPNESWIRDGHQVSINKHGWRDFDYDLQKAPSTLRVVVVGDSVTHGYGVDVEEIYAKQLEAMLNQEAGTRHEVIMLTVGALNTRQEAHLLAVEGMKYEPDVVVVGYVLNDPAIGSSLGQIRRTRGSFADRIKKSLSRSSLIHLAYRGGQNLVWKTRVRLGRDEVAAYVENDYFSRLHRDEARWQTVVEGMDVAAEAAAQREVPVVWLIFPVLHDLDDYSWRWIHRQVAEEAAARQFHVLDLLPSYERFEASELQVQGGDHVHPNPLGHRLAAEALLELLIERQLLVPTETGVEADEEATSAGRAGV